MGAHGRDNMSDPVHHTHLMAAMKKSQEIPADAWEIITHKPETSDRAAYMRWRRTCEAHRILTTALGKTRDAEMYERLRSCERKLERKQKRMEELERRLAEHDAIQQGTRRCAVLERALMLQDRTAPYVLKKMCEKGEGCSGRKRD